MNILAGLEEGDEVYLQPPSNAEKQSFNLLEDTEIMLATTDIETAKQDYINKKTEKPELPVDNVVSLPYSEIKEFAVKVANEAHMPYCWQDIIDRLYHGKQLPFKVRAS